MNEESLRTLIHDKLLIWRHSQNDIALPGAVCLEVAKYLAPIIATKTNEIPF